MSQRREGKRYTRGVRASRVAVSKALLDSGLKTQVALAARIAELEGLETPPKDSVSRAFREKSVDPSTIMRIARALGVEPHTLYLTGAESTAQPEAPDEAEPLAASTTVTDTTSSASVSAGPGLAAGDARALPTSAQVLAVVLILTSIGIWLGFSTTSGVNIARPVDLSAAPGGVLTVVISPSESADSQRLHSEIVAQIDDSVRVTLPTAAVADESAGPEELRTTLRAHLVLSHNIYKQGRYVSSEVRWNSADADGVLSREVGVWAEKDRVERRAGVSAGQALLAFAGAKEVSAAPQSQAAQQGYLTGRALLDNRLSDRTVLDAHKAFSAAAETAPEWALGHAGLCDATLLNSWTDNEQKALVAARTHCDRALRIAPADPYVRSVWGHYLRRVGQSNEALVFLESSPESNSLAIESKGQLAEVEFARYRQSGKNEQLTRAIGLLRELAATEPDYWRWHALLATYSYYAGELGASVLAGKAALSLQPQPMVLANLGMAQFCLGDIEGMLKSFRQITVLDPENYMGLEYSGVARFFLGDYSESARLRQLALAQIGEAGEPEIHDMWGGLGDSLRHAEKPQQALVAYRKAAEILERDILAGIASVGDHAHRAFYSAIVAKLSAEITAEPEAVMLRAAVNKDLSLIANVDLDRSARVRVAQLWQILGEPQRANTHMTAAIAQCEGLAKHPDF